MRQTQTTVNNKAGLQNEFRNPEQPSKIEIENRILTHVPFRSRCAWCIVGKCPTRQHRIKASGKWEVLVENPIPKVSFDYLYLNQEDEKKGSNPMMAMSYAGKRELCVAFPQGTMARRTVIGSLDF